MWWLYICVGDDPADVKTKLRHWAQAVACSVMQKQWWSMGYIYVLFCTEGGREEKEEEQFWATLRKLKRRNNKKRKKVMQLSLWVFVGAKQMWWLAPICTLVRLEDCDLINYPIFIYFFSTFLCMYFCFVFLMNVELSPLGDLFYSSQQFWATWTNTCTRHFFIFHISNKM